MIIGLVAALVIGVLAGFFITRSITAPVNRIISGLNEGSAQVADSSAKVGDLIAEISAASKEQSSGIEQVNIKIWSLNEFMIPIFKNIPVSNFSGFAKIYV